MYGATVGEVSILKIESTTNQAVCGIFPNKFYSPIFLYSVLKNSKNFFVERAAGGAQPNISQGIIKDFMLITPSIEEQQQYFAKIAAIEQKKKSINRSIAESQKLFDYTMDKYFG
jgi:type I restriction enzyme S subunit